VGVTLGGRIHQGRLAGLVALAVSPGEVALLDRTEQHLYALRRFCLGRGIVIGQREQVAASAN